MDIAIIGGGIGGLTTALALHRKGIKSTVYEASPEIKPVGAGIILASNATQVLQRLGVLSALQPAGQPLTELRITDEQLRPLSRSDLQDMEQRTGGGCLAIHRAELQRILLEHLPSECVQLNHQVTDLEVLPAGGAMLHFANGLSRQVEGIVAADGLHSLARSWVAPASVVREAHQICWRGVAEYQLPPEQAGWLQEAWGSGRRFGFSPISPGEVYWYALRDGQTPHQQTPAELQATFQPFAPIVHALLAHTPAEHILVHAIKDHAPLAGWARGPVCLLGDAAHATTPNMGQGACQAIVDAYTLAELLGRGLELRAAFAQLYALRQATTAHVTTTSWRVGKLAHVRNPVGCYLRNTFLRLTPARVTRRQNERLFQLEIDLPDLVPSDEVA